jgi:uncharacterized membrane protein
VLRGKFIAVSADIKRTETSQINNLMMYLKLLKKQEQTKPQNRRWREIIKIRAEINDIKTKLYKESMKQTVGSLKTLTRLTNPRLNQEGINHLNSPITCNEIEAVIVNLQKRAQDLMDL